MPGQDAVHYRHQSGPATDPAPESRAAGPRSCRTEQTTKAWQDKYARRAGAESTIAQSVAVTDTRHARYHGLPKTRLEHNYKAVALNLIRLDAWWNGHPPRPTPDQPPLTPGTHPRRVTRNDQQGRLSSQNMPSLGSWYPAGGSQVRAST
jgi:hypothetical protein